MRLAFAAVVLLALAAPASAQRSALFAERPSLDALVPTAVPSIFEQETWTESSMQHCFEWGFPTSARSAIEGQLRSRLRAIGWDPSALDTGTVRRDGGVLALAPGFRLDRRDPSTSVLKVSLCTEGLGQESERAAFMGDLARDPLWPSLPFDGPFIGWRRTYSNGGRAIGLAFDGVDAAFGETVFRERGYLVVGRDPLEMRKGRLRARFGGLLWWQAEHGLP